MKRVAKDGWFQMFAAIAGLAAVVSLLNRIEVKSGSAPTASAAAAPAASPAPASAPAPAAVPAGPPEERITPLTSANSSLGLVSPSAPPPAAAVPPPPAPAAAAAPAPAPQMTLTGTGVGNSQGIPSSAGGRGIVSLIGGLLGGGSTRPVLPPPGFVRPARPGVFNVDPAGGGDTTSLRDAAASASDGDLILVKPGRYDGPVEVVSKKVTIKGLGNDAGAVTVSHSGPAASVVVRDGTLTMEKVRVMYGSSGEFPPREPHGALYAAASTVVLKGVELGVPGTGEPALIAEQGDKATTITVEDSELMGGRATVMLRGPLRARFVRTKISGRLAAAAWLEARVSFVDCRFDAQAAVSAYEGALAGFSGAGAPRVVTARDADSSAIEANFGSTAAAARRGFSRDIFRRGREPGALP